MADEQAPAAQEQTSAAGANTSLLGGLADEATPTTPATPAAKAPDVKGPDAKPPATEPDQEPDGLKDEAADPEGKQEDAKAPEGAPEAYAEFELPEGTTADPEVLAEFSAEAKRLNLTQEEAQRLVTLQAKQEAQRVQAFEAQRETWRDEIRSLPDWQRKAADAKLAVKQFGDDKVRELFNTTWIGDDPRVFQFLAKIGKLVREDGIAGGASASQPKTPGEVLFGDMI